MTDKRPVEVSLEKLRNLITTLDNRQKGTSGIVVYRDELVDVLQSLSSLVPANILVEENAPGYGDDYVNLKVVCTFMLSRSELGM